MLAPLPQRRIKPTPLTEAEYQEFKVALTIWRDTLIAMTLRNTGLRVSELLRLEVRDCQLDIDDPHILARRSKSRSDVDEYERLWLNPLLAAALRAHLKEHRLRSGKVFPVTDRNVRYAFARAGLRSIERAVRPHELRGLFIRSCIDGGLRIESTADLVGHKDPRVTQRYYYATSQDLRRQVGKIMPV